MRRASLQGWIYGNPRQILTWTSPSRTDTL
jgi:hypothetical protein